MESIGAVVTDNSLMNEALARWEWDTSRTADRDFAKAVREREARITAAEYRAETETSS